MNRRPFVLVAAALSAALCALSGCAVPGGEVGDDAAQTAEPEVRSAKVSAIEVDATYRMVVIGTPTYGFDATEPFLTIQVIVDDAALLREQPGFDGYERAFALVPRAGEGGGGWERIEIPFAHRQVRGYMSSVRWVDVHRAVSLRLSDADLSLLLSEGVAIGLETNVGTIWAQDAGENFAVTRATRL
jgi:hypothetical protein